MNKIDRWINNLSVEALKQALGFLLHEPNMSKNEDNVKFMLEMVEDFSVMYPQDNPSIHGGDKPVIHGDETIIDPENTIYGKEMMESIQKSHLLKDGSTKEE